MRCSDYGESWTDEVHTRPATGSDPGRCARRRLWRCAKTNQYSTPNDDASTPNRGTKADRNDGYPSTVGSDPNADASPIPDADIHAENSGHADPCANADASPIPDADADVHRLSVPWFCTFDNRGLGPSTPCGKEEVVGHAAQRWAIEVLFADFKELMGSDHYQIRSAQGIVRFWALGLCLCLYQFLDEARATHRRTWGEPLTLGQARQQIREYHGEGLLDWIFDQIQAGATRNDIRQTLQPAMSL